MGYTPHKWASSTSSSRHNDHWRAIIGWVYDKHHFRYLATLGMMIMALSMMLLGSLAANTGTDPWLLLCTLSLWV